MRRLVIAALGLAALGGLTAAAEAGQPIGSSLTIRVEPGMGSYGFQGKVGSPKESCKAHRVVRVFQKQGQEIERIGRDETNQEGRWQEFVEPAPTANRFFAKMKRRQVPAGTCLPVQTDTVQVP